MPVVRAHAGRNARIEQDYANIKQVVFSVSRLRRDQCHGMRNYDLGTRAAGQAYYQKH